MKNLFFLLLVLTIGSCTVTKRHFRSGYYISWNKVNSSSPKNENRSKNAITVNNDLYKEASFSETSLGKSDSLKKTFQANYSQHVNIPPDSLKTNGSNQKQKKKPLVKRIAEKRQLKHPKKEKKKPLVKRNAKKQQLEHPTKEKKKPIGIRIAEKRRLKHPELKEARKQTDNDKSYLYADSANQRTIKTIRTLLLTGLISAIMGGLFFLFFDAFAAIVVGLCIPIYFGVYRICIVNSKIETRYRSIQRRNLVYHIIALSVCIVIAGSLTLLALPWL